MRGGVVVSRKLKAKEDTSKQVTVVNSNHFNPRRRSHNSCKPNEDETRRPSRSRTSRQYGEEHSGETNAASVPGVTRLESPFTIVRPPNGNLKPSLKVHDTKSGCGALTIQKEDEALGLEADASKYSLLSEELAPLKNKRCMVKVAHSADAFMAAGAAAKGEERLSAARKQYYRKAIALITLGGFIFIIGVVFAALHFAKYPSVEMVGPICLAIGLLLGVCGLVWIPIIKTKLKRKQQMMTRTFSL